MIEISLKNAEKVAQRIARMMLTPKEKERMGTVIAKAIIKDAKDNVRAQSSESGGAWAKRQKKKGAKRTRGKMLRGLVKTTGARKMSLKITAKGELVVGWENPITAQIARAHQDGFKFEYDAKRRKENPSLGTKSRGDFSSEEKNNVKDKTENISSGLLKNGKRCKIPKMHAKMATTRQAKALSVITGFRWPSRGGASSRRSQSWIEKNISFHQAGVILRSLGYLHKDLEKFEGGKTVWEIEIPKRRFLELKNGTCKKFFDDLAQNILKRAQGA